MECFLALLAAVPDTLVARKLGRAEAERVSRRAREVLAAGGPREGARRWRRSTPSCATPRNTRNPGTTADLTCAAFFAVILEDGWNR